MVAAAHERGVPHPRRAFVFAARVGRGELETGIPSAGVL
jgi:hypothetical protein